MQILSPTVKVLIIEDNSADFELIKQYFAKNSTREYQLTRVELLAEGIDYLQQNPLDVILLDLNLPDSKGLSSLTTIQKIAAEIPIVVITAIEEEEVALASLREGAQDYLIKGEISHRLLKKTIAYAIERHHLTNTLKQNINSCSLTKTETVEGGCRFLPDGTLTFVDAAYCNYLNKSAQNLLGQKFSLQTFPQNPWIVEDHLAGLSRQHPLTEIKIPIITNKGKIRWEQWCYRAIFKGDEISEYQAFVRDISQSQLAEIDQARLITAIQEEEELFKTVVDKTPALIWMTNALGDCIFFNQTWLHFTGRSLSKQVQEGWTALVHPTERAKCNKIYHLAFKNQTGFNLEHLLLRSDGSYRWMYTTAVQRHNPAGEFVGLIGSCIDITARKQAEEKLEQQAESNRILTQITQSIHSSLDLEKILYTAVEEIGNFLQAEKISVIRLNLPDRLKILYESVSSAVNQSCDLSLTSKKSIVKLSENLPRLAAGEVVASGIDRSSAAEVDDQQSYSALLIPIIVERKLWGLLYAEKYSVDRECHFDTIELLNQVSVQLAIAIHQSELYQKLAQVNRDLEELSTVDPLTNIANRRKFDRYLAVEWQRSAREKAPLSLIMCDIDYFKLYNDTYGHQAGDRCIKWVAQAISKTIKRPADLVTRYGGEEFAIILPNTTADGAEYLAQQIRLQIGALQIPHINSPIDLYITLSLGVAGFIPTHDSAPEALIAAADSSLYQAKELGRNRVVKFSVLDE